MRRARHDDALVHARSARPRSQASRVGRRPARARSRGVVDEVQHVAALPGQHAGLQEGLQRVQRQVQRVQHEVYGLVPGVVRAVAQRTPAPRSGATRRSAPAGRAPSAARRAARPCCSRPRVDAGKIRVLMSGVTAPPAGFPACGDRCSSGAPGSASSTRSLTLWMVALHGPNSITCGQILAMKRPSEVPPVVESSVFTPVSAAMAAASASVSVTARREEGLAAQLPRQLWTPGRGGPGWRARGPSGFPACWPWRSGS